MIATEGVNVALSAVKVELNLLAFSLLSLSEFSDEIHLKNKNEPVRNTIELSSVRGRLSLEGKSWKA